MRAGKGKGRGPLQPETFGGPQSAHEPMEEVANAITDLVQPRIHSTHKPRAGREQQRGNEKPADRAIKRSMLNIRHLHSREYPYSKEYNNRHVFGESRSEPEQTARDTEAPSANRTPGNITQVTVGQIPGTHARATILALIPLRVESTRDPARGTG